MKGTDKRGKRPGSAAEVSMMSAIARASLDALITIDYEGKVVEFSPVAESMFGYKREEALGVSVAEIVIPPRLRQAHNDGMARYHQSGKGPVINTRVEVPAQRRNGEEFPAELTVVPLELEGEKYFTAFVRDITELKQQQELTEKARQAAEEASQAKSRFLAHMSHELRSPLTTVLGAVDLLQESGLSQKQEQYAGMALASGENLLELISGILDFSRIESGQLELNYQRTDLHQLLSQLAESYAQKSFDKGLDFAFYQSPRVPRHIECDPTRLRQILANFLDNALKFTDEGAVTLSVKTRRLNKKTVQLRFSVQDSGIGLSSEHADSIFGEFTQVDNSDSTAYSGAGLGLAIVKLLAQTMRAEVGVDRSTSQGVTFWLDARFAYEADSARSETPKLPKQVVALVDQPLIADCLKQQFKDMHAKFTQGKYLSALSSNSADQADLILIDYDAVQMGHGELLRWLADEQLDLARIRLLARPADAQKLSQTMNETPLRIITKPICHSDLRLTASQAMDAPEAGTDSSVMASRNQHLLLAEDSMANQMVIRTMLQDAGYKVTTVDNGKQALDAVTGGNFDLVLMDLRMPVMDGLEATQRIRELAGPASEIRILALTANALKEDIDRCLEAGMNDHLTKPVKKLALLAKIDDLLAQPRS